MGQPQNFSRDNNGMRFLPGGIDTVTPTDSLKPTKYAYLQNVRAYKQMQIVSRATESSSIVAGLPTPVHSLRLLNDTTPLGPVGGFVRIIGAAGAMYVNATQVASGLSGNPVSILPFRPNASVRPYAYIGDGSENVILTASGFPCTGQIKINSNGTTYKTGVKEPQTEPVVSTQSYSTTGTDILPATAVPWTNVGGKNPSYNYGQTNAADGTSPIIITGGGPFLVEGSTVTVTVTGTATVNGASHAPGDAGPSTSTYPGNFVVSPTIVLGCWTDGSGNVLAPGSSPAVFPIGASATLTVPAGAEQLHIGIDSSANTFSANSGSYTVNWTVTVSAIATVLSTLGEITAYVWGTPPPTGGGSPHSGPVAEYIWKNPNDSGSGISRSITDPVPDASPSGNSWVFDSSPEDGTVPVNWNILNADGSIASTIPLFSPALESEGYQDFNCAIVGNLFVPTAGTYLITFQYKDQVMIGMSAGATAVFSSGTAPLSTSPIGSFGQTISVVNGLPLIFVSNPNGSGTHQTTVMAVTFNAAGVYQIEVNWDYWFHSGRSFIMTTPSTSPHSPTIPPITQGVRTGVQYRYIFRSSATGAISNPSPESAIQLTPVLANLVTPTFSNDPQVDKVDFFRLDDNLTNFTYVGTVPNTNPPTPLEDELSDTDIANNPILEFDNYEPFPVIDLPHKGTVNVTGGIISWVSGDKFNIRWLPGTDILIGSPTSLAYTFISRPYPAGFSAGATYILGEIILDPANHYQQVTIPGVAGGVPVFNDTGGTTTTGAVTFQDMGLIFNGNGFVTLINLPDVPDGTNLAYEIPEPDLAAQPLPFTWGPTDNTNYYFGVGDQLNPGTLYFSKGNNPDSAPQTNQIPVTSPNEALINGVKTASMGMVWTTERRWLIYDTFSQALATVEGIQGTAFNVVESTGSRGLYIPTCVTTNGGMTAFFRGKDGIYSCEFGGPDTYICADIYNLFPREGVVPQPIVVAGNTIYPPDDTRPTAQRLSYGDGFLFYDYEDSSGNPHTLVYDEIAQGWIPDVYQFPTTIHAWEEGPKTNAFMVGCTDGSVRVLGSGNAELATSIVIPGSQNAGDARAFKTLGDVFIKAIAQSANPINVSLYANRYSQILAGVSPATLAGTGLLLPYVVDFTSGDGFDLIDAGVVLSWNTPAGNLLDLWQPDFVALPETTQDRPTDWGDLGQPGDNFVQGLVIEADTNNVAKTISVEDEFGVLHTPTETPIILNGQQKVALSFATPFISHIGRIVSTDGVPWRMWGYKYVSQPYPELAINWSTELIDYGPGWGHMRYFNVTYIASQAVTLVLFFDQSSSITISGQLPITASQLYPTKKFVQCPRNKSKLTGFTLTSSVPWRLFKPQLEIWHGPWGRTGPYNRIQPFGGDANQGAEV
jgi:hypothetical protein